MRLLRAILALILLVAGVLALAHAITVGAGIAPPLSSQEVSAVALTGCGIGFLAASIRLTNLIRRPTP